MNKKSIRKSILFLIVFAIVLSVFTSPNVIAQSSRSVPVSDPSYDEIDKLIGYGVIKSYFIGQRPWTRLEFARLIKEAESNIDKICKKKITQKCLRYRENAEFILSKLKKNYAYEINKVFSKKTLNYSYLDSIQSNFTFLDSPSRSVPMHGIGVNAIINPMVMYKDGKHYQDGFNYFLQFENWLQITPYVFIEALPLIQLNTNNNFGNAEFSPTFQHLYFKGTYRNIEFLIGRDSIIWGQGKYGGILFSNNARPLDMIKVSTPYPFELPWVFKHVGKWKAALFVANLGPDQAIKYGFLAGAKLTLKPVTWFEISYSQGVMMGGDGAPTGSLWDYFTEFFASRAGFLDSSGAGQEENLGNRIYGFDIRLTAPFLNNAQLYYEMFSDDAFQSKFTTFWAYSGGIYFPMLPFIDNLNMRIEGRFIPERFYHHSIFLDGWTLNNKFLGDGHGMGNKGISVNINYGVSNNLFIDFLAEHNVWYKDIKLADEKRMSLQFTIEYIFNKKIKFNSAFGYERVDNFDFIPGNNRNNFLINLGLVWNPFLKQ